MAKSLKKTFEVNADNVGIVDKGSEVPQWYKNGTDDYSNWWSGGENDYYFYSIKNDTVYIQYGQNATGWASTIFIVQTLDAKETTTNNNEIQVDGDITVEKLDSVVTQYAGAGVLAHTQVTLNGKTIKDSTGMTNEGSTLDKPQTVSIKETIKPQGTSDSTQLTMKNSYPNGEYQNSSVTLGLTLKNPNLPQYIPMAIRLSDGWEELDSGTVDPNKDNNDNQDDNQDDNQKHDPNIKENYNLYNIAFQKGADLMQPIDPNGTNPDYPFDREHMGVDTYMTNEKLFALTNGTAYVFDDPLPSNQGGSGFGRHIIIDGDDGYQYMFGHLQSFNIQNNTKVKVGDLLGVTGSTGDSTAPHLHFEVRKGAEISLSYGGTGTVISPLTWRKEIFGF